MSSPPPRDPRRQAAADLMPVAPRTPLRPAYALRECLRGGYGRADLKRDILAGITVGVIALPLSMALAIASGVPPQHGLYTAIIAGAVAAVLGGSRVQVTGPTAAFVVILAPVSAKFGLGGLALASAMAGALLILMAVARLGRLIQFIPYPVTAGFTAGIAVVIATLQVKDFLGLTVEQMPESFIERAIALGGAMPTFDWADAAVGAATLALLILWPRFIKRVPAPLAALTIGALLAVLIEKLAPGSDVATIRDRFAAPGNPHGIPQSPPAPGWPWLLAAPGAPPTEMSFELVRALLGPALAIAMLGAIESLLSAVVADGMSGHRHDPDAELLAQGVGNVVAPFFGGFAATGAIARTSANIRFGARSPIAAVVHAGFVLAALLLLAPLLGWLPMAALAALLLRVAWHMSEARHFIHTLRIAPRSDTAVLLTCFTLTVVFDMVIAVGVGVVLAAMLFMKRMAEVAGTRLVATSDTESDDAARMANLPRGVLLYEITGPMFFGAAQKAMSALHAIGDGVHIVVLDMRSVPVMDMTGLVNLRSALDRLERMQVLVILAGVQKQPLHVMGKAHLRKDRHFLTVAGSFEQAMQVAEHMAMLMPAGQNDE